MDYYNLKAFHIHARAWIIITHLQFEGHAYG